MATKTYKPGDPGYVITNPQQNVATNRERWRSQWARIHEDKPDQERVTFAQAAGLYGVGFARHNPDGTYSAFTPPPSAQWTPGTIPKAGAAQQEYQRRVRYDPGDNHSSGWSPASQVVKDAMGKSINDAVQKIITDAFMRGAKPPKTE